MKAQYKRRRPHLIWNLWVYRKLVALAIVLGLLLWFVVANRTDVIVVLPFWLGSFVTHSGIAILLGALVGSAITALTMTVIFTLRRRKDRFGAAEDAREDWDDDRPPPDYAAKTPDGFSDAPWTAG